MKNLLFFILLFPLSKIGAQTIEGRVVNNENKPIPNCIVHFDYSDEDYSTDEEGIFKIRHTKKILTSDSVIFSCLGYKSKVVSVKDVLNTEYIVRLDKDLQKTLPVKVVAKSQEYKKVKKGIKFNKFKALDNYRCIYKNTSQFAIDFSTDTTMFIHRIGINIGKWNDTSQVFYLLITKKTLGQKFPDTNAIILRRAAKIKNKNRRTEFEIGNVKLEAGDYFLIADFSSMKFPNEKGCAYSIGMGCEKSLLPETNGYIFTRRSSMIQNEFVWINTNSIIAYHFRNKFDTKWVRPLFYYPALRIELIRAFSAFP